MVDNQFYHEQYQRIEQTVRFNSEFPDETTETTLKSLWSTASGMPCSATLARSVTVANLSEAQKNNLLFLIGERIRGIPLAHLTGRVHFMGCELQSGPDVLIPRAETELIGAAALEVLSSGTLPSRPIVGIDVGCGSGNLSCGIASKHPGIRIYAVDIAEACVRLASKNAAHLHLEDQITVYQGDLFAPLSGLGLESTIDFIVSNPPYIPAFKLQQDLSHLVIHEPEEAFNGGTYGFALHQRLIRESLTMLKTGGHLLFEFGIGQEKQVDALFRRVTGYGSVDYRKDANGNPRVAIVRK